MRTLLVLALACSMIACGDDDSATDSGASDAMLDSGSEDSGAEDSGAEDSGAEDTGTSEDTGASEDSGSEDADTGMADTGTPDTGMPDTGTPDTGTPDTGRPPIPGAHPDIVRIIDVRGRTPGGRSWADSYSVGDRCYCESTFDHAIGPIMVDTPAGRRSVRQVCDAIGPGPGSRGSGGEPDRPLYNDIQCGNGPANDAGDEDDCPGRVDIGRDGCGHIGPRWNFDGVDL